MQGLQLQRLFVLAGTACDACERMRMDDHNNLRPEQFKHMQDHETVAEQPVRLILAVMH